LNSFCVSAPVSQFGEPAFDANFCSGRSIQEAYKPCDVVGLDVRGDVQAMEHKRGINSGADVFVQYTFTR
jgi:hypothetical protein